MWIDCPGGCDDRWCTEHEQHAFECPCPALDEPGDASAGQDENQDDR